MKNNINKVIILAIILLLIPIPLTGCQLALEDATISANSERLYGVYITIRPSGVSNYEPVNRNNSITLDNNGDVQFEEHNWFDGDTKIEGTLLDDGTIHFSGFDGYYMGIEEIIDPNGELSTVPFYFVVQSNFYSV